MHVCTCMTALCATLFCNCAAGQSFSFDRVAQAWRPSCMESIPQHSQGGGVDGRQQRACMIPNKSTHRLSDACLNWQLREERASGAHCAAPGGAAPAWLGNMAAIFSNTCRAHTAGRERCLSMSLTAACACGPGVTSQGPAYQSHTKLRARQRTRCVWDYLLRGTLTAQTVGYRLRARAHDDNSAHSWTLLHAMRTAGPLGERWARRAAPS